MSRPAYMTDDEWRSLAHEIDTAAGHLTGRHPALLAHERFVRALLAELAHHAYENGMAAAYRQLRTSAEVAAALGVRRTTILYHANRRNIGWRIGRDRLFRPADIDALRQYVGRPPGPRPAREAAQ